MNYSTAIFLINKEVRAIAVTYEKIDVDKDTTQMKYQPAYLSGGRLPDGAIIFKTMNQDVAVNDFVIVPTDTRHGMTVCKVVGIDIEIDFDSDKEVHWIVGTVSTMDFEEIRQLEEQAIIAIKSARVNEKRDSLSDSLLKNMGKHADGIPMLTVDVPKQPANPETPSEETVEAPPEDDTPEF